MQGVLDRQPTPKGWVQPMPLGSGASETVPGDFGQPGKNKAESPLLPGPLRDSGPCPFLAICLCRNSLETYPELITGMKLTWIN